jgi:hypothetical protein
MPRSRTCSTNTGEAFDPVSVRWVRFSATLARAAHKGTHQGAGLRPDGRVAVLSVRGTRGVLDVSTRSRRARPRNQLHCARCSMKDAPSGRTSGVATAGGDDGCWPSSPIARPPRKCSPTWVYRNGAPHLTSPVAHPSLPSRCEASHPRCRPPLRGEGLVCPDGLKGRSGGSCGRLLMPARKSG